MAQRPKPQLRFGKRLEELHEQEQEDSHQLSFLAGEFLWPIVVAVCIAAIVSVMTWLRESLAGRANLVAAALFLVCIAALVAWRRLRIR